ncbi:hypothetical protein OSB04_011795 [Centaurea solstitialis]|uniref:Uncharacterized protein n=1 Tax=Centaurea solstitialis TaxID=347529 RepID=A0AA38WQA9_9ASTR|nr:hypothetical protein OSB04_011795 [Centaurea solstitialis]
MKQTSSSTETSKTKNIVYQEVLEHANLLHIGNGDLDLIYAKNSGDSLEIPRIVQKSPALEKKTLSNLVSLLPHRSSAVDHPQTSNYLHSVNHQPHAHVSSDRIVVLFRVATSTTVVLVPRFDAEESCQWRRLVRCCDLATDTGWQHVWNAPLCDAPVIRTPIVFVLSQGICDDKEVSGPQLEDESSLSQRAVPRRATRQGEEAGSDDKQ